MAGLAIVLLVRDAAGSFALAGLADGSFALGSGIASPLIGRAVDRGGQTRVLLGCAVVCAAAFSGLAIVAWYGPIGLLPVLAGIGGATVPPIGACMRALWSGPASSPPRRRRGPGARGRATATGPARCAGRVCAPPWR